MYVEEIEYKSELKLDDSGCLKGDQFKVCPDKVVFSSNGMNCQYDIVIPTSVDNDMQTLAQELETHTLGLKLPCNRYPNNGAMNGWKFPTNAYWGELISNLAYIQEANSYVLSGNYQCHGIQNAVYQYKSYPVHPDLPTEISIENKRYAEKAMDSHCAWVHVLKNWVDLIRHRAGLSWETQNLVSIEPH
jgi:hypothetical protein